MFGDFFFVKYRKHSVDSLPWELGDSITFKEIGLSKNGVPIVLVSKHGGNTPLNLPSPGQHPTHTSLELQSSENT